jgi:hypothetical protein
MAQKLRPKQFGKAYTSINKLSSTNFLLAALVNNQVISVWREINNQFELMKKVNSKATLLFRQGAYTASLAQRRRTQALKNHYRYFQPILGTED